MVPSLSALSLALCHEALECGGNHKMETSIAKRNFPNAKTHEASNWKPSHGVLQKLKLLLLN